MQDISSILGAAGKSGTDIFSEPNSSPIVSESNNAEKFSNIFNEISETYNQSESSETDSSGSVKSGELGATRYSSPEPEKHEPDSEEYVASDQRPLIGSELPQLALHQRALAVGRIVLTTADTKVSTQSLSAFIDGQALARPSERVSAVSDVSRIEARSNSSHQSSSIESANNQSSSIESANKQDIEIRVEKSNPGKGSDAQALGYGSRYSETPAPDAREYIDSKEKKIPETSHRLGLSKDVEPAVFRAEIFESRLDRKDIDQSVSRGPHLVGELGSKTGPLGASNKLGLSAELNSYSRDGLDSHGGRKQHPADSLNNERSLIGGKAEEKAPSRVAAQELPPLDRGVEKTEPRLLTSEETSLYKKQSVTSGSKADEFLIKDRNLDNPKSEKVTKNVDKSSLELISEKALSSKLSRAAMVQSPEPAGLSRAVAPELFAQLKVLQDRQARSSNDGSPEKLHQVEGLADLRSDFRSVLRGIQFGGDIQQPGDSVKNYEVWSDRLSQAVASRIQTMINSGGWQLNLRLDPASLGEINIELQMTDSGMEGKLAATDEATRQLLQDSLQKLRAAMKDLLEPGQDLNLLVQKETKEDSNKHGESNKGSEMVGELDIMEEVVLGFEDRKGSKSGILDILV